MSHVLASNIFTDFINWVTGPVVETGLPSWLLIPVAAILGLAVGFLPAITVLAMFSVWMERKVSGHIQCRYGPMYVGGWHGWAQSLADGIKLLIKEDLMPRGADRRLFVLAPAIVMATAFAAFVALPLAPDIYFTKLDLGVLFIIAITSVTTIGVIMAGWASNNKWSVLGAMREAAQVVSYEIPLGLALMVPVLQIGSLNFHDAIEYQGSWGGGPGFLAGTAWTIFRSPFVLPAFMVYFVAALAETKRAPFDLPESESELVAGFHTEYSGMRFSFFFLEEYAVMFLVSCIAAAFFFGGWHLPGVSMLAGTGVFYQVLCAAVFVAKGMFGVFVMMWMRWTLPRVRIDQVMTMGYKYLVPIAFVLVLGQAFWIAFVGN